jgi:hypothetical protein
MYLSQRSGKTKPIPTTVPIGRSAFPGVSCRLEDRCTNKANWERSFKFEVAGVKCERPSPGRNGGYEGTDP